MPIYEYQCKKCGHSFERRLPLAKMTRTAKCPECGAPSPLQLSLFAVVRGAAPDLLESSGIEPEDLGGGDDLGMGDDFDF